MKDMKHDTNRWRDIPFSWVERINIVKMTILPKAINRFMLSLLNYQWHFFTELEQKILKFYGDIKDPE